jgi:predicted DNA-binding transcriptional regulator AlpA
MKQQHLVAANLDAQSVTRNGHGSDLLRQIDVCARLGISDQTWMRWRKAGRVPDAVVLPSGRLRWRRDDIERLAGAPTTVTSRNYFPHASSLRARAFPQKVASRAVTGGGL